MRRPWKLLIEVVEARNRGEHGDTEAVREVIGQRGDHGDTEAVREVSMVT